MKMIRRAMIALSVVGLLTYAQGARAQAEGDEGGPSEDDSAAVDAADSGFGADERANDDVAPTSEFGEVPQPAGIEAGAAKAPPQLAETHNVERGDTLWDLCGKYLNSPWYWPKIWSYNPQISNPHWIFPGNELRFYPTDENLPTNIEVGRQIAGMDGEDLEIPDALDESELVKTVGTIHVKRNAPNSVWSAFVGFLSKDEHARAGKIVNSEAESVLLSDFDKVYVTLKVPANPGDGFAVYRTVKAIEHPVTGEPYGYAVEILGGVTISATSPTVATAEISHTFRPIERGDYVGPWPESFNSRVEPTPNDADIKGYVLETVGDVLSEVGEHTMVFIDRGRNQGVQKGNVFTVFTRGDGYTLKASGLPNEDIGQLMVVDVQDNASTAVVTYSAREISVGDKIEMRVGS
ncbi:MAG: LysM peptidoglycan-binding domain-containing protein [Deltaproteobacteria bacterium]|nr:LysM peptidoglycan-binding domain-containing protein [Deltaproteobacteria bacterium]